MKKKTYLQLALLLILFHYFYVINAVAVEYNLEFNENTKFIWRVEEYEEDTYKDIFIEEADFEEDDQQQIRINSIDEREKKWVISYDIWDYTDNTEKFRDHPDDEEKTKTVYKDPEDQGDNIEELEDIAKMWVVPTPHINYIEEFRDEFDNSIIDVSVEDDKLIAKYAIETAEYEIEMTYGNDGLAEKIEYINEDGDTFVKIVLLREEIPGYNIFLIIILICGVISVIIWRKKLVISKR